MTELRQLIQERFTGAASSFTAQLPDGWLHWPITAGGLSLLHPMVLATGYAESYKRQPALTAPDERNSDWQRKSAHWYRYYKKLLAEVRPVDPRRNQVMETLVEDFIQRGAEISQGGQKSLSAYWRWIVYLYGPEILDRFGTFRFLLTELVPAQLITRHYRQGLSDSDQPASDTIFTNDQFNGW